MAHQPIKTWLIVAFVLVAVAIVMLLLFYLCSWIAYMAGKFLDGVGDPRAVRSAMAWGLAPLIWAVLYRVPAAIYGPPKDFANFNVRQDTFRLQPGITSSSCLIALLLGTLELAMLVWYFVVASRTLAEAHRFNAWRGFGTLMIVAATPIIIAIAAVLAMH